MSRITARSTPAVLVVALLLGSAGLIFLLFRSLLFNQPAPPAPAVGTNFSTVRVAGEVFADALPDGSSGPAMVVVPGGRFWMGGEPGPTESRPNDLQRQITLGKPIAVAQTETTVAQFRKFMSQSNYVLEPGCWHHSEQQEWQLDTLANWDAPGYPQTDKHAVSCLNWRDANAYAHWISRQTGRIYRLPSEAEFEYFNRAGSAGEYAFDVVEPTDLCRVMNAADHSSGLPYAIDCRDGVPAVGPVARFAANKFGLHDTSGNLWEFTGDCWNNDYGGNWRTLFRAAPLDGSAWNRGDCRYHVIRGGSFLSSANRLRLAWRERGPGRLRLYRVGFRLVGEL